MCTFQKTVTLGLVDSIIFYITLRNCTSSCWSCTCRTTENLLSHFAFSAILPLSCIIVFDKSPPPLLPLVSHTLRFLHWSLNILPPPSRLLSISFSLSVSLPCVVSVAGVLLFLTATALTSMTFFSCLVRHQTPALGEATLLHRRRATAKLCTGTAQQWSRSVSGRR